MDAKSGELLEDVESGTYGLRALELGRKLDKVRDIEINVELRDPEAAAQFEEADDDAGEDDGTSGGELAGLTDVQPDAGPARGCSCPRAHEMGRRERQR